VTGMADGRAAVVFDFYGTLTPVNSAGAWIDHTSRLAALLGVEPEALARALDESYPERATGALGDVRQTLRTLATRLGVQLTEDRLDEACQLPDPHLFRAVAERLAVDPAACLYVGDGGGRELTGSTAVGMHAVLLAGPDWHDHRAYDQERDWGGPRISSLEELLR